MRVTQAISGPVTDWFSMKRDELRYNSRHWTVVYLHEVMDRERFKALLSELERRYQIVSMSDGFRAIKSGSVDGPCLTLTFDDGDKTVSTICLPELENRRLPACLFVCTG